jgi:hypothetical protein
LRIADSSLTLAALSAMLAGEAEALAAAVSSLVATPAYLELVRCSQSFTVRAEQVLKLCVQQCRDAGHTWQEIGDLFGVTRQAAFQRFGRPIEIVPS